MHWWSLRGQARAGAKFLATPSDDDAAQFPYQELRWANNERARAKGLTDRILALVDRVQQQLER